eukprot:791575-Pelagomonas_calceolata.AAC.2
MHSSKVWGHTQCSAVHFGSDRTDNCCQSWGYTRCILCCGAERAEFGCAHVRLVGLTHASVYPLVKKERFTLAVQPRTRKEPPLDSHRRGPK